MNESEKYLKYKALINLAIKRLNMNWKTPDEYQEINDWGTDGIIKGIRTYQEDKGVKESTYVYKCIENELKHLMKIRSAKKRNALVTSLNREINEEGDEIGDLIPSNINVEKEVQEKITDETILRIVNQLKDRRAEIIKYRLGLENHPELTFEEIAKIYGVNKNAIRDSYTRAIRIVYSRYKRGKYGD